jgi:hypothetical protein
VVAVLLGSIAVAAVPQAPADRPAAGQPPIIERIEQAMADLKLSDEQKGKIQDILNDARQQLRTAKADLDKLEPAQRAQKIGPMLQQLREDLMSVLDNDQKSKLEEKMQQFRQRMREREKTFAPATQPSAKSENAAPPFRPGVILERVRDNLEKLNLSAEQKEKVDKLFEETKSKGQELMQQAREGGEDAKQRLRELAQQSRKKLGEILSPEQLEKLRQLMQADGFSPPAEDRPAPGKKKEQSRGEQPAMKEESTMMEDSAREQAKTAAKESAPAAAVAAGPAIGDPAPDLKLQRLDGGNVQLAQKGRITVVVFGSLSCPSFRQRAAALEKLKETTGNRANVYVIYSKEAHPLGGWEVDRNKAEGISIDDPKTIDARRALASKARDALKLSTPILIDTMDNTAMTTLGAGANSAFVIARDGTLAARQQWFEPAALRRYIDQSAAAHADASASN